LLKSTKVIPDDSTTCLKGFEGCSWIAQEYLFKPSKVNEIYKVDMKAGDFTEFASDGKAISASGEDSSGDKETTYVCVYEVQDKISGTWFAVAEGYKGFLKEPAAPDIRIEQFFSYFPLTLNDIEDEENEGKPADVFPPSDVRLMKPMQEEYNRSRHAMREHRMAARPGWASPEGALDDSDMEIMETRRANELIKIKGLRDGQSVDQLLQAIKYPGIDPNLYNVEYVFADTQRVVGASEEQFGATANGTATSSSIAASSHQTGVSSNIDDVDEWLSDMARAASQVLLAEMSVEQVREICGPGAVWPELSAEEIMREVFLNIEAGSSGKPNRALEISNWERMLPYIVQMPGASPKMVLKETLKRTDDRLEIEDFFMEGQPSIAAMNAMGPDGVNGMTQGPQGAMNAPAQQGGGGNPNMTNPAQR